MANEELQTVCLKDEFYRDGFYRVLFAIGMIALAIGLLIAVSAYLYLSKPKPVVFSVDNDRRVLAPVPVDQPYLAIPDLTQWVSRVIPTVFTYDFINYTDQLKDVAQYFTPTGWKKFLDILNAYVNYNNVKNTKLFVSATPAGAPIILNQGLLQERYAWWVQMPLTVSYSNYDKQSSQPLVIQALVVRVPTLNNIYGVGIDNMMVSKGEGNQVLTNG
jgi:intracellular multiplication protein IcmL